MSTTRNSPRYYEPLAMTEYKNSNIFHTLLYRNPETETKETIMDDFMSFVEDEFEMSQEDLSDLQTLVNAFVGYDSDKAKRGELEMLARWNKSVKGE